MKNLNYRLYPLYFLPFIRVAMGMTLGLAIPLYYTQTGLNPEVISFLFSATALSYLFSPLLFRNIHKKIGKKKCLLIASLGFILIQIGLQFSLEPVSAFILLFLDGVFLGLFWPVLLSTVSAISDYDAMRDNDLMKNQLLKHYSISWNLGSVFSYLLGACILFFISDILLMFKVVFIYSIIGFIFVLFFKEPKSNFSKEQVFEKEDNTKLNSQKENLVFPILVPLFLITMYAFSIGSIGLIYPIKSELLHFALFTNYLFNFIRMTAQTILISKNMSFSINTFKKITPFLLIIVCFCFFIMGFSENLILFGILFGIFGTCISFFYSFAFKLIVFRNIEENSSKYSVYFETIVGLNFWLGPITCGFIAVLDINLAFFFLSAFTFAGFIIYIAFKNKIKID